MSFINHTMHTFSIFSQCWEYEEQTKSLNYSESENFKQILIRIISVKTTWVERPTMKLAEFSEILISKFYMTLNEFMRFGFSLKSVMNSDTFESLSIEKAWYKTQSARCASNIFHTNLKMKRWITIYSNYP